MGGPGLGSWALHVFLHGDWEDGIMKLFRRTPQAARGGRKPSRAERRAAERTAQAEAKLARTEQQIHDLADEVRRDLGGSAGRRH
jgi:hypothetical protein